MTALTNQPENTNFLSPLGYKLVIKKLPHLNFFIQSVTVPSVSLGTADVETPFTKIPFPGTKLTFQNLEVTFKIDEDMQNYIEIFDWMNQLGFPDNFAEYQTIAAKPLYSGDGIFSDMTLTVLTSAMNPNITIDFVDCFPVDLSSIIFDSTSADVEYLTATITFANRRFNIRRL